MTKVAVTPMDADKLVEGNLDIHLAEVETQTGEMRWLSTDRSYLGSTTSSEMQLKTAKRKATKKSCLCLLETAGGYITVAQRIADTFRASL